MIKNREERNSYAIYLIDTMHKLLVDNNIATSLNEPITLEQINCLTNTAQDNSNTLLFIMAYLLFFENERIMGRIQ